MTGFKIQTRARMMMWMIFSTRAFHAYASKKSSDKLRYVAIRGTVLYDRRCYGDRGMGGGGLVVVCDNIDKTRYAFFIFTFDNNLLFSKGELKYKKRKRRSGITCACLKPS